MLINTYKCDHPQKRYTIVPKQLLATTRACLCPRSCSPLVLIFMAVSCVIHAPLVHAPESRTIASLNPASCGPCRLERWIESHLWPWLDSIITWRCSLTCRRRPPLSDARLFLLAWLALFWSLSAGECGPWEGMLLPVYAHCACSASNGNRW